MERKKQVLRTWRFAKTAGQTMEEVSPAALQTYEEVTVPHTWYEEDTYYRGTAVYQTVIECVLSPKEEAYLEFQGVEQWCQVYINEQYAGEHKGGYSTFRIPVKREYLNDGTLQITVVADNGNSGEINPVFGDFTVFGGIYRPVYLLIVPENHFDLMYYGTSGILLRTEILEDHTGMLSVFPKVCLGVETRETGICYEVLDESETVVLQEWGAGQETRLKLQNPVLWDGRGHGHLYKLQASLVCDGELCDRIELDFGFRTVSVDAETGFHLNGRSFRIHGVAKHQDYEGCFNAVGDRELERDMELIREIGANAVRLSHYQHPEYIYELCDREGIVVWAEIPMLKMTESKELLENAKNQLTELVLQNLHHPSICFWGIQNEIGMFKDTPYMHEKCRELEALVRKLDSSRITTCANLNTVKPESRLNTLTQMVGYNLYFGWYYGNMEDYGTYLDEFHEKQSRTAIGVSEYGVDCNPQFHSETPEVMDYSEEFQSLFHETVYPILEAREYLWGSFVWNLFDFCSAVRKEGGVKFRNCKGLVTYDRKTCKDAFYYYKARWSEEPFVRIAGRRFVKRNRDKITVKIYSNLDSVELYIDGNYHTTLKDRENGMFLLPETTLSTGGTVIKAVSGEQSDEVVFYYVETPEESYRYQEAGAGGRARNWFLDADEIEEEGRYSVKDSVNDLLESDEAMGVIEEYMPMDVGRMREDRGTISLLSVIGYVGDKYDNLDIKELNRRLNEISK